MQLASWPTEKLMCVLRPPQDTCKGAMSDPRLNKILNRDEFIKVKIKQSFFAKIGVLIFMANKNNNPPIPTNLSLRSVLEKDKLNGSNFLDWERNLQIVLRQERKWYVLETPLGEAPASTASVAV